MNGRGYILWGLGALPALLLGVWLLVRPASSEAGGVHHATSIRSRPQDTPTGTATPSPTPACSLAWQNIPSYAPGYLASRFVAVAVSSASDAWAVGSYQESTYTRQTFIEHWNGVRWDVVPSSGPGTMYNYLESVATVSANDVWAVGFYRTYPDPEQMLIEHWDGTQWRTIPGPDIQSRPSRLRGVAAVGAN